MEKSSNKSNFQINIPSLIESAQAYIKVSDFSNGEYYINLAYLCQDLEFASKIQVLAIRSFIHFSEKKDCIVLLVAKKFLKENSQNSSQIELSIIYCFVRALYRAGLILLKNDKLFLSAFFFFKAKNFLEKNQALLLQTDDIKLTIERNFVNVLDQISQKLRPEKEKFIAESYNENSVLNKLRKIFLPEKYSLDLNQKSNSIYLVSNLWMNNLIHFLKKDLSAIDKLFDRKNVCVLYFNQGLIKEDYKRHVGNYPGPINNYYITELKDFWYDPLRDENYTNMFLRKDAKENLDFIYLNEDVYFMLKNYFDMNFEIERKLNKISNGNHVNNSMQIDEEVQIDIHLKRIKILVLSNLLLDGSCKQLIRPRYIQISKSKSLLDLKLKILRCMEYECKKDFVDLPNLDMRLVIPELTSENKKNDIFEMIYAYTNKFVQFKIKGEEINNDNLLVENLKIAAKDLVIIEIKHDKDPRKNWFINLIKDTEENKSFCSLCDNVIMYTPAPCDFCSNYLYCSTSCKNRDEHHIKHHQNMSKLYKKKIELSDIVSIDIDELIQKNSRGGLTGLKNLGNTCFMNSALQCLSNNEELTKYFLLKKFEEEINKKNKYGSGGQIAKAYYDLIRELWLGSNSYLSPWDFRQIFVGFIKQFAGFSQHDSHEMLAYMLDALHEDLNRVKDKPYFELKEKSHIESEEEASRRWWNSHLSRENSIVVDLYHGQFKSTITCPDCNRISITYDAFMHLGLPIPAGQCKAKIKFFPSPSSAYRVFEVEVSINENTSVKDIKSAIKNYYLPNLKNNAGININYLTSEPNLEAIVTSEKAFKKILQDNDTSRHVLNAYENNHEIVVYETALPTKAKDVLTFYIQPVEFLEEKSYFVMKNKVTKPLFYIRPFTLNTKSTVEDLYVSIFKYYRKLMNDLNYERSFERFLSNYDNEEYVREEFKLYFSNENSIPLRLYFVNNVQDNSACEFCGKYCDICPMNFNLKSNLGDIQDELNKKRPILLCAELLNRNERRLVESLDMRICGKNIFSQSSNVNIYDCLDSFRLQERLEKENTWYCSECKRHQEAFKRLEIYKAPNHLIIQFKRFKIKTANVLFGALVNKKNDCQIDFPIDNLDLRQYVVNENDKKDAVYELYGISQHYGSLSSGHYTALCRNRNNWHSFDDDRVSRTSEENVVTSAAYLLFYKKKTLNSKNS